jgi:hypothetical protein
MAAAVPAAAQVYTADAGVTSPNLRVARESLDWLRTGHVEQFRADTRLSFSPRTDLEMGLLVPWVRRRVEFEDPGGGRQRATVEGLGDMHLHAKFALERADDVMQSDRLSLLGILTLPTGADDARTNGFELPRRLQLGLGAPGTGLGIVKTIVRNRHRASAEFVWRHAFDHEGFAPGDLLTLNLAWWYRLVPATFDPQVQEPEWRLTLELLSDYQFTDRDTGGSQHDGGVVSRAAVGLQCNVSPSFRCEGAIRLPLFQNQDGVFGDERFGFTIGLELFF